MQKIFIFVCIVVALFYYNVNCYLFSRSCICCSVYAFFAPFICLKLGFPLRFIIALIAALRLPLHATVKPKFVVTVSQFIFDCLLLLFFYILFINSLNQIVVSHFVRLFAPNLCHSL